MKIDSISLHGSNYTIRNNGMDVPRRLAIKSYGINTIPTFIMTGQIAYYKTGYSTDIIVEIKTKIDKLIEK